MGAERDGVMRRHDYGSSTMCQRGHTETSVVVWAGSEAYHCEGLVDRAGACDVACTRGHTSSTFWPESVALPG